LLFGGPSGVGKTSAAQALAGQLGLPALEVDVRALLDSEQPAGLVDRLFTEAAQLGAVLVLAHADAAVRAVRALGVRGYAIDPDALSTLRLNRLGSPGPEVIVFCSELIRDSAQCSGLQFDEAFLFPEPDAHAREQIWNRCLPAGHRLSGADVAELARSFRLVGRSIARCCERARRTAHEAGAPVSLRHVAGALEAEYRSGLISDRTRAALADLRLRGASRDPNPLPSVPTERDGSATGTTSVWADRERERQLSGSITTAPPQISTPRRSRRARSLLVAVVVIGAAAAGALGIAVSSGGPRSATPPLRLDHVGSIGAARFAYPSSWRARNVASVSGQALSPGVTLAASRAPAGQMVIGLIAAAGAGIPAQFIPASLSATASPQLVRLGSGHFYRLLALSSAHEALYASAGTSPELVAACQSASAAFAGDCERVLATLALTPTPAPAPAPIADPAYARQLSAALAELNRSRTSLSRTLALAQTAAAQARAAASLAAVHLVAANAIARLKGGSATAVNRELVRALRGAAIAYARLAQAATRGNGTAYAAAEPAVGGANASIADALSQLRTLGYTVT
jgi:hypothetical protein